VARLFIEGDRFEALSPTALLEREYETLLLQYRASLFPSLIAVRFNPIVVYEGVSKRPDLALIEPDYSRWWVVEAELSNHSLHDHVLPQVEVLARATYGDTEANWLADREDDLDRAALCQMMRGAQPKVLVVVNEAQPDWVPLLRPDAEVMVVEPFRSDLDRYILRQNGYELQVGGAVVSLCRPDPQLPRMVIVDSPVPLRARPETIAIEYAGSTSNWRLIEAQDRVWLSPERGSPFPPHRRLALRERDDGTLVFEPAEGVE
jgi:hypothetical protein